MKKVDIYKLNELESENEYIMNYMAKMYDAAIHGVRMEARIKEVHGRELLRIYVFDYELRRYYLDGSIPLCQFTNAEIIL